MREAEGRNEELTAAILDSQSVKSAEEADRRGDDANQKVKGRKRPLLVDVLGLLLIAFVSSADVQDMDAAAGAGLRVEIVRGADEDKGFVVQTRLWVAECTNAWMVRQRRLRRDYERQEE